MKFIIDNRQSSTIRETMNKLIILTLAFCATLVSSQTAGVSTRYWDCCKPSCSWSGKAPVSAPVQTCDADGVTPVSADTTNVCGGEGGAGKAYTCNNNQPVAINSSLAMGFVAGAVAGQSEADSCCACYELTFTSTAVSGQKMIVQVTNTGGDLGSNHFDIQIPGGGVGIFNGCSDQWGAPADGWGSRYGGVSSAADCSQLPTDLQSGCEWRFGWFQNADNPDYNLVRVQCPGSLVAKTKCQRDDDSSVSNSAYAAL